MPQLISVFKPIPTPALPLSGEGATMLPDGTRREVIAGQFLSENEYEHNIKERMSALGTSGFEKLHQTCAKKLLDGVVDYAKELGFAPHPDYKNANELFGNIDASVCPVKYTYSKDGKTFYMNRPFEPSADIERILNTLTKKCGADGFNIVLRLDGDRDDDFM